MTETKTRTMDGKLLASLLQSGYANLCAHEEIVNDLNVFPIPDGDTGNNMCMTVEGGVAALSDARSENISEVAHAVSDGALLTARGNSGVILSQLIAGVAEGLTGYSEADCKVLAKAALSGVKKAYSSVITPVEGTVLTVAREAAEKLNQCVEEKELSVEDCISLLCKEMHESLQRTPELLPTLKEAGVIDSGGAGLVYLMEGMERSLNGESLPEVAKTASPKAEIDFSGFTEESVLEFGYCTEFLLRLQKTKTNPETFSTDTLIERLQKHGESIVAFKTGSIVKVHIHTFDPGTVLSLCREYGEFLTMKIENMSLQHSETKIENRFAPKKASEKKPFGIVAVASGDGLAEAFTELGADAVIRGGQTMNPSAKDFLDAFARVNAETVFVLPNNKNIFLAAKQAGEMYPQADVRVLESTTLGEGYQAMTMLDFTSGDAETIAENLNDAIRSVTTASVSHAVRDASLCGETVHDGEYLGFVGKTLYAHNADKATAAEELLDALITPDTEVLVVLIGAEATEAEADAVRSHIRKCHPSVETYEVDAGQSVYDFIFIL